MAEQTEQAGQIAQQFHPNNYIDEDGIQWKYTRCFFCHMNCGLDVGVDTKTGRIVKIKGNEKEGTVLCDRMGKDGRKAIQFHYHPKRVNHALRRVGERFDYVTLDDLAELNLVRGDRRGRVRFRLQFRNRRYRRR